MTATRRLAAILAADVAGYSRLMGADEEGTHERLKAHLQELRKDAGLIHPYRQAGERQPSGDGHREIATHLRDAKSGVLAPPETGAVDPPLRSRDRDRTAGFAPFRSLPEASPNGSRGWEMFVPDWWRPLRSKHHPAGKDVAVRRLSVYWRVR